MTIRHLRIFIAVAETGKMGLAAKQLFIAQPTVSQVIADIEESYGVQLFERLSKKLYITDAGRQLLSYARHIVSLFDEMECSLRNASAQVRLKLGATITVGACVLTQAVRRFEASYPPAQVQVFVDNTQVIEQMLLRSQLDLALAEGAITHPDLVVRPVIQDELVLVCGAGHPFAERASLTAADLQGQAFVLREEGSGTRAMLEEYLKENGVTIDPKWVCHSADSILNAVADGQGLTLISRLLAGPLVRQGRLHQLPLQGAALGRTFNLVYHKNKYLSDPLRHLMETIAGSDHLGS